jgi:PST family polysaccharide transporter
MSFSKEIFSALFKSGMGTIGKIAFNAVAIKIIAVIMGPYGVGLFTQIRQIWQTTVTIGSINSGAAIVQGVSSREGVEKTSYISSIFWIVSAVNVLTSLLVFYYSLEISDYFLNSTTNESGKAIKWLSLTSFFGVYLIFFSSLLNGYHAIGRYSIVITIGSLILMLLAWPVAVKSGNFGLEFVWMLTISEFVALVVCIVFLVKGKLFSLSWPTRLLHSNLIMDFFSTSSILLVTGVYTMAGLLWIRVLIVDKYGFHGVGIFDAAWLLCMVYVLVVTKSFGTYFLPKLSSIDNPSKRNNLMNEGIRIVLLIAVPVIVIMISLKPLVVSLLYTDEFTESLNIMKWMLIGDLFKILSWFLAFTILAYKDMRVFLWSELIFFSSLLIGMYISIIWIETYESIGVVFMIVSIPYFIFTVIYNQIRHGFKLDKTILAIIALAIVIITISSINTWHALVVDYRIATVNIVASIIFSWFVLNKSERNRLLHKKLFWR